MKNMKCTALAVVALAVPAMGFAQDASGWSGFYLGATTSGVDAKSASTGVGDFFTDAPDDFVSLYDSAPQGSVSGLRAGVNFDLGSGWLAGVAGAMNFGGISAIIDDPASRNDEDQIAATIDQSREITVRVGYVAGQTLIYGIAGMGTAQTAITLEDATVLDGESRPLSGYVMGAGIEQMLTRKLSLSVDYIHTDYGTNTLFADQRDGNYALDADVTANSVRVGVNYRF